MKVHHLNCGTMAPVTGRYVAHVLLLETDNGLVLVDSGFGLDDIAAPARLGPLRHLIRPVLSENETALRQIERLGFTRADVRHIVTTHLDLDHIGGLSDFPDAQVHTTSAEALGATTPRVPHELLRYRRAQLSYGPKLVEHDAEGEAWRGFAAAKELDDIAPGVVLISLPGHTRGHACIAVDAGHRWVLHSGDAFLHRAVIDDHNPVPLVDRMVETALAHNRKQVRANHRLLAELARRGDPDLLIINAHDPLLFEHARATQYP
ncbi:MBL fold metallo-hydrolase [Nocardia otitidiscaviarum]|uniref:MBL fold metallo-hydrolase n=1 Tax=Nocardia otitidiscaviarum TaxID=1823 RepID=UPI0004A7017B|nr:MBL fold metallo-hydrolase [Nocardia otitidiscaviarum]MBF6135030.1 MBL fold metallo-hydrolase [Nocardia otitidiscaviarum]MBF6486853.1 MBL fold metallo-hydrolase [Nocardia otitidiscaviarum]